MTAGIAFTATYIIGSIYGGMSHWCLGIGPQGIGVVGMLLNFGITLALTPFFPAPSASVRDMVENMHEPESAGPPVVTRATAGH